MHIHPLITDSATLANLCTRLAEADFVCIDTEFMRENTFWPELCLIQIADTNEAAAIDPMAPGLDLAPLLQLMVNNDDVLKVFHAGGQDLEIIYNLTGKTPYPLFDTQVAAMALGQGEQIGYSNLVDAWLGLTIDKGARFTDWSRRPLDARQIEYAIGDVTHLADIFPRMLARLRKTGRGAWLDQEMERIGDPKNYANDPEEAWKRIRIPSRKPDVLGRLKALARWREIEARSKDLPRGRIVKDETIADLAGHAPRKQADLAKVRGLSASWAQNDIGARLMSGSNMRPRWTRRKCPRATIASPVWARTAHSLPTCSSCCSRSARRKSTSPRVCWRGPTISMRWRRVSAKVSRSSRAGASTSSGAMRSIWSRGGSRSRWSAASLR